MIRSRPKPLFVGRKSHSMLRKREPASNTRESRFESCEPNMASPGEGNTDIVTPPHKSQTSSNIGKKEGSHEHAEYACLYNQKFRFKFRQSTTDYCGARSNQSRYQS